jgi:hypothetical protein
MSEESFPTTSTTSSEEEEVLISPEEEAPKMEVRIEHDLLGDEEVPLHAYYGIQTMRAMQNFDITGN